MDRELMLDVEARLFAAVGEYGQGASEQGAAGLRSALQDGLSGGVLTEDMINDVGYYCLENGLSEAAVEAFMFNVEQFPDFANAHKSLGDTHSTVLALIRRPIRMRPRDPPHPAFCTGCNTDLPISGLPWCYRNIIAQENRYKLDTQQGLL
ncbi:MAG: hypothetical protein KJ970_07555 [Candidatus Eisenbacteria bacterium]|uniref:Uncharacterized protein n=1 Tax=Eiseniibacteriota bacterium TaxID=2212470 RepID=A0A948RTK7_UNCEI|nr:hypothetical protein [Candidatus Eisenbacteria bacterium]MBU1950461.1 hypothetical protein [Candidatus Eisenbacteria bacterium]MBU2690770.1 hypothetical protein [Candidatus Eisenbacteria bacterium]